MSWKDAQDEAAKWLGTLKLGRDLFRQTIDLREPAKSMPYEGKFRDMVLEAARRKLIKRGAKEVILPPAAE